MEEQRLLEIQLCARHGARCSHINCSIYYIYMAETISRVLQMRLSGKLVECLRLCCQNWADLEL